MNSRYSVVCVAFIVTACGSENSSNLADENLAEAEQAATCATCPPSTPTSTPGAPPTAPSASTTGDPFHANIDYHYVPEHLMSINGRTALTIWNEATGQTIDDTPDQKMVLRAYDFRRVMSEAIGWPVGDFSGLHVPVPATNYQRGVNANAYGSTAFQVFDTAFGFQLSSNYLAWSPNNPRRKTKPGSDGVHIGGIDAMYKWETKEIRPWLLRGDSARLRVQHDINIDHFDSFGFDNDSEKCEVNWFTSVILRDLTSRDQEGKYVEFQWATTAWHNDHDAWESILADAGTHMMMVNTKYAPDTRFITTEPNSKQSSSGMFNKGMGPSGWYAAYIDGGHIRRVAEEYNKQMAELGMPTRASLFPKHYSLRMVHAGPELVVPDIAPNPNKFCHLGGNLKNIYILTMHNKSVLPAVGALESLSADGTVKGWALTRATPHQAATIEAWVDGPPGYGRKVATVSTSLLRADVNASWAASGNHGFSFRLPSTVRDGKSHVVRFYATAAGAANTWLGERTVTLNPGS